MPDPVSDTLCRERQRVQDERFKRDLERIEDLEQVCDKLNREYLLLTTDEGGVYLMPYLDEHGDQAIMPQA